MGTISFTRYFCLTNQYPEYPALSRSELTMANDPVSQIALTFKDFLHSISIALVDCSSKSSNVSNLARNFR